MNFKSNNNVSFFVSSNINEYNELLKNDSISTLVLNLVDVKFNLKKKNTVTLLNNEILFLNKELDLTNNQEIFNKIVNHSVFEKERGIRQTKFKIMHITENKLYDKEDIIYKLIEFYDKDSKVMELEYTKKGFKISIIFENDIILKDQIKINSNSKFDSILATNYTFFIDRKCFQ